SQQRNFSSRLSSRQRRRNCHRRRSGWRRIAQDISKNAARYQNDKKRPQHRNCYTVHIEMSFPGSSHRQVREKPPLKLEREIFLLFGAFSWPDCFAQKCRYTNQSANGAPCVRAPTARHVSERQRRAMCQSANGAPCVRAPTARHVSERQRRSIVLVDSAAGADLLSG